MTTTTRHDSGVRDEAADLPDWFVMKEAMRRHRWGWLGWTDRVFHGDAEDTHSRATRAMLNAAKGLTATLEDLGYVIVRRAATEGGEPQEDRT